RHRNRWLLTKHPTRGIEFPGGKVEEGERAETAAIREVLEETGGVVKTLEYIAQYNVTGKKDKITKNVNFAHIWQLTYLYKEYEKTENARIKEGLEETGGVVKTLEYIAQYNVTGKKDTIIKNVYFAHIGQLTDIYKEYETLGPLFIKNLPTNLNKQNNYSFMMKDD